MHARMPINFQKGHNYDLCLKFGPIRVINSQILICILPYLQHVYFNVICICMIYTKLYVYVQHNTSILLYSCMFVVRLALGQSPVIT